MKPLHIEYRPETFDEFIGNDALVRNIKGVLNRTQTFLFHGMRGCGKTTLARLIAKELQIDKMDVYEIDAADKTSVDDARQLKATAFLSPLAGKKKIYIIDECHRLSGNAMDSLLKIFEEPPKFCYFVLCTTEPEKVSATIKSRCKSYEVKPIDDENALRLIDWICTEEKIVMSSKIKQIIIDECNGIPREIVIAVDMLRAITDVAEAEALITNKTNPKVIDLCRALLKKEKWKIIADILKELNEDPESIRYAVLGYMSSVLLNGDNKQAPFVISSFSESFIYSKKAGLVLACYQSVI